MEAITLTKKFAAIDDYWNPRIIAALNGQHVKIAKVRGTFIWHSHEREDELFYVVSGRLTIDFRDKSVELGPGEMLVVPRGVEHRPRAEEEVQLLLFEPAGTVNTGEVENEMTKKDLEQL